MSVESEDDVKGLAAAGRVVAQALSEMRAAVRPGVTTRELDRVGANVFARHGARSAPQLAYGFPGVNCISVNDEAVHGVPSPRRLRVGDIVKLDVTAELDGYMADAAVTVAVGRVSNQALGLIRASERALSVAVGLATTGRRLNELGRAVEREVHGSGFRVLCSLTGHGIGRTIHEPPSVKNYYDAKDDAILTEGLVITIEPIIAATTSRVRGPGSDGWTISTRDGSLSAHAEHTVIVREDRPTVLTAAA